MSKVIPQIREWDFVQIHYHGIGDNSIDEIEDLLDGTSYLIEKGGRQLALINGENIKIAHDSDYVLLQKDIGVVLVLDEIEMTRMFRKTFRSN
ncbi:MAG: hypothetical protein WBP82_03775 [Leuconostoc mesenteroides]